MREIVYDEDEGELIEKRSKKIFKGRRTSSVIEDRELGYSFSKANPKKAVKSILERYEKEADAYEVVFCKQIECDCKNNRGFAAVILYKD